MTYLKEPFKRKKEITKDTLLIFMAIPLTEYIY